jgi:hypothetical protein
MGVILTDQQKLWPGHIPYVDKSKMSDKHILEFNTLVGKQVFRPRNQETDYVSISWSSLASNCKVGRQGGEQQLNYGTKTSLFHEMCHACAIGHENFNTGWPGALYLVTYWSQNPTAPVVAKETFPGTTRQRANSNEERGKPAKISPEMELYSGAESFNLLHSKYRSDGQYDPASIMLYSHSAFGIPDDEWSKLGAPPFVKNTTLSALDIATIASLF